MITKRKKILVEIVACMLLAAWLTVSGHLSDKVLGVEPVQQSVSQRCETSDGQFCHAAAVDAVNTFNAGGFRSSRGYEFPLGIKAKLAVSCSFTPGCRTTAARDGGGDGHWWRYPISGAYCIPYSGWRFCGGDSIPNQDRAAFNHVMLTADLVTLKCGIAAAIGYTGLRGGGAWWGAGKGAAVCLWMSLFSAIFSFKVAQMTNFRGASDVELAQQVLANLPDYSHKPYQVQRMVDHLW